MRRSILYKIITILVLVIGNSFAQDLSILNIQGVVRDDKGGAVDDADYQFIFNIYDSEDGLTSLWSETQTLSVASGVYSADLGSVTPFDGLGFDIPYYVGVSFDGDAEASPRIRLTAAPYALSLQGVDNVFPSYGTVGVGTSTPDTGQKIHILGNALIEGDSKITGDVEISGDLNAGNHIVLNRTDTNEGNNLDFTTGDTRQFRLGQASSDALYLWNNSSILMKVENEGDVTVVNDLNVSKTVDADNLTINSQAPFVYKKYDLGDGYTKDYNTEVLTSEYYCSVIGVQRGDGDIHENGTIDLSEAYAYSSGGTWWLRASSSASASDNIVYTLFIKAELVSDSF